MVGHMLESRTRDNFFVFKWLHLPILFKLLTKTFSVGVCMFKPISALNGLCFFQLSIFILLDLKLCLIQPKIDPNCALSVMIR